jgi:hypothetical protein
VYVVLETSCVGHPDDSKYGRGLRHDMGKANQVSKFERASANALRIVFREPILAASFSVRGFPAVGGSSNGFDQGTQKGFFEMGAGPPHGQRSDP